MAFLESARAPRFNAPAPYCEEFLETHFLRYLGTFRFSQDITGPFSPTTGENQVFLVPVKVEAK